MKKDESSGANIAAQDMKMDASNINIKWFKLFLRKWRKEGASRLIDSSQIESK